MKSNLSKEQNDEPLPQGRLAIKIIRSIDNFSHYFYNIFSLPLRSNSFFSSFSDCKTHREELCSLPLLEDIATFFKSVKETNFFSCLDLFTFLFAKNIPYNADYIKYFLQEEVFSQWSLLCDTGEVRCLESITLLEYIARYMTFALSQRDIETSHLTGVKFLYEKCIVHSIKTKKIFTSHEKQALGNLFRIIIESKNQSYKYFFFANESERLFSLNELPSFLQGIVLENLLTKSYPEINNFFPANFHIEDGGGGNYGEAERQHQKERIRRARATVWSDREFEISSDKEEISNFLKNNDNEEIIFLVLLSLWINKIETNNLHNRLLDGFLDQPLRKTRFFSFFLNKFSRGDSDIDYQGFSNLITNRIIFGCQSGRRVEDSYLRTDKEKELIEDTSDIFLSGLDPLYTNYNSLVKNKERFYFLLLCVGYCGYQFNLPFFLQKLSLYTKQAGLESEFKEILSKESIHDFIASYATILNDLKTKYSSLNSYKQKGKDLFNSENYIDFFSFYLRYLYCLVAGYDKTVERYLGVIINEEKEEEEKLISSDFQSMVGLSKGLDINHIKLFGINCLKLDKWDKYTELLFVSCIPFLFEEESFEKSYTFNFILEYLSKNKKSRLINLLCLYLNFNKSNFSRYFFEDKILKSCFFIGGDHNNGLNPLGKYVFAAFCKWYSKQVNLSPSDEKIMTLFITALIGGNDKSQKLRYERGLEFYDTYLKDTAEQKHKMLFNQLILENVFTGKASPAFLKSDYLEPCFFGFLYRVLSSSESYQLKFDYSILNYYFHEINFNNEDCYNLTIALLEGKIIINYSSSKENNVKDFFEKVFLSGLLYKKSKKHLLVTYITKNSTSFEKTNEEQKLFVTFFKDRFVSFLDFCSNDNKYMLYLLRDKFSSEEKKNIMPQEKFPQEFHDFALMLSEDGQLEKCSLSCEDQYYYFFNNGFDRAYDDCLGEDAADRNYAFRLGFEPRLEKFFAKIIQSILTTQSSWMSEISYKNTSNRVLFVLFLAIEECFIQGEYKDALNDLIEKIIVDLLSEKNY